MTPSTLWRRLGSVAAGLLVAGGGTAARAAISVNTEACPQLRPALLQDRLALELAAAGPRAPGGDVALTFQCSATAVRIDTAGGGLLREVPAPSANDTDKERTIALAATEALVAKASASTSDGPAPSPKVATTATVRPGGSLAVEARDGSWRPGVAAYGWLPLGLHTAIRIGARVAWWEQRQPGGELVKGTIPGLDLAITWRSPIELRPGWPKSEMRLFVAPAVAIMSGLAAADEGQRAWTITTGYGWSAFWRAGPTLIGLEWNFGFIWPGPVSAFDPDRSWLRRTSMRYSFFVGFEAGGG